MKLPNPQLKNCELVALFQKSSILEQHFFPKQVPFRPVFKSHNKKPQSLK